MGRFKKNWTLFQNSIPPVSLDCMFDEISVLNASLSDNILPDWANTKMSTEQRWLIMFQNLRTNKINVPNLKVLVEFSLFSRD